MTGYNGRKGPNVSQYIADLNTIPTAHELALQDQAPSFLEEDVLSFMNTDFIDWDSLAVPDVPALSSVEFDPVADNQARRAHAQTNDFVNNDFQFPDFTSFSPITTDPSLAGLTSQSTSQPQQFSLQQQQQSSSLTATSPSTTGNASASTSHHVGDKRKRDSTSSSPVNPEEAARFAAEEDKRRRNTAASARFRVKKKQREQALEKTAKEMTEKVGVLEAKVQQLEMENKWLKSLITEKNGSEVLVGKGVREMYEKFTKDYSGKEKPKGRTDGVGTAVKMEG